MFCQNCGNKLQNGARFCSNCGSAQAIIPPAQLQTESPFAGKVLATAKKVGSSPSFLIATIFFTLTLVLNLLAMLPAGSAFAYEKLLAELHITDRDLLTELKSLILVTEIINMLPTLLITIGLWITYGTCISRKLKVNTAGLTIIFVVNLVVLVFTCLGLLAALFLCILVYVQAENAFSQAVILGVSLSILAMLAFILIYYIKLSTTITNVRSTLKTGVPNKRASRFVGVMCYIGGGVLILSGISSLFSAGVLALDGYYDETIPYILPSEYFLSAVTSLLTATAQILFGVLIFSYRSKMMDLEAQERMHNFKELSYAEPYTSPVYIPPQPAQEPEIIPEPKIAAEPDVTTEPEVAEEPTPQEETE